MRYRYISFLLALLFAVSAILPVTAAETVEVFVTLEGEPLADAAMALGGAAAYLADEAGARAVADAQTALAAAVDAVSAIPGAEVLGQSWFLTRSIAVRLPADRLDALGAIEDVLSVELMLSRVKPESAVSDTGTSFAAEPFYAPDLLGLDSLHAEGVLGEGIVAAVIDSGFDVSHPVFTLPEGSAGRMTVESVANLYPQLNAAAKQSANGFDPTSAWVSEKIPFAYDYYSNDTDVLAADVHGTHVASILGGGADTDKHYVGVAPAVQLLLMKVFDDGAEAASSEYAVYRALEDALLLGADVISLSIGVTSGYSYATNSFSLEKHLLRARELGCAVICAVGNDGTVGRGSAYDVEGGTDAPLAANPDYGLIADPASFAAAFSVGAYTPDRILQSGLGAGDGSVISFTDSALGQGFTDMSFRTAFDGQTLEYAVVPGVGGPADYAGVQVKGKLALVRRGTISFAEKLQAAAEAGAIGMLCYDNVDDGSRFSMAFDAMPIPAVSLTRADGERLAALETAKRTITVSDRVLRVTTPAAASLPADYSTRGSGLLLRPSVLSPGSVYAALPGGGYGTQNGTSMATPVVSGLTALALGQRKAGAEDTRDTAALDSLLADLITTAEPVLDADGHPYSVRTQGGGAIRAEAFLSPKGRLRAEDGRGVVELGDGLSPAEFSFSVTLSNPTKRPRTYAVSASVASDGCFSLEGNDAVFVADTARMFADAEILIDGRNVNRFSPIGHSLSCSLDAGESRTFTFTVSLSTAEAAEYADKFPNGYYLEGFVFAEAADGERLSLPYLGFAGDFDALPTLDPFAYDGEKSFYAGNYLLGPAGETMLNLGCSYYDDTAVFRRDLLAISPNGDGYLDEVMVNLRLLRNLYALDIEITDADGRTVKTCKRSYYLRKTYFHDGNNTLTAEQKSIWNGEDSASVSYIMPDGNYTVSFRVLGFGDVVMEEVSLPLVVDTKVPELLHTKLEEKNGRRYLTVTLQDNHYPMRAVLYRNAVDEYGRESVLYRDAHNISYKEGRRAIGLIYDITDYTGDYLYLDLYDYAMNQITHRIPLN